jgi:hypothetical protein
MVAIGNVPWTREDMIGKLEEFAVLNEDRPIRDNIYGMRAPHMFLAWFVLQWFQPGHIIESGVAFGQGSWFFERACPEAQLHCIEPYVAVLYRPGRATYYTKDFSLIDWDHLPKDGTVLFFDDHQDAFERVRQARQFGFVHLLIEDNYPVGQGDCYSLKKAFEREDHAEWLRQTLEVYQELPPVFVAERTRWGDAWSDYSTPAPLLDTVEEGWQQIFWDEVEHYTWMCYAKVRR